MSEETYKIVGNLKVYPTGEVHNADTGRVVKGTLMNGYNRIRVNMNGSIKKVFRHRLVALAYIGEIPDGYEVHHINGNKLDNRVSNLQIISRHEHRTLGTA